MERGMRRQQLLPITATALTAAMSAARAEVIDFESAAVDSVPQGWLVAMTHEGEEHRWAVVPGDDGEKVLAQLSDDPTAQRFPLAVFNRDSILNGTLSVRFKPVSGRVDQAAGLVWRYKDENNYYLVRANALEDNVVLYKIEGGNRVAISPLARDGEYS
jgi:hypothetical protein